MNSTRAFTTGVTLSLLMVFFITTTAGAVTFVASSDTQIYVAPSTESGTVAALNQGDAVEVLAVAGTYYKILTPNGQTGFASMTSLNRHRTRAIVLAPILIAAGSALGKVVLKKAYEYYNEHKEKKKLLAGREFEVLETKGDKIKVKTAEGKELWIKKAFLEKINEIRLAAGNLKTLWGNGEVKSTDSVGIEMELERLDGTSIGENTPLKLGDKYKIKVKVSKAAYVRITSETPDLGGFCQFYPNFFEGYKQSVKLEPNKEYSTIFLPPGKAFEVGQPIGAYDMIRIEASTESPFIFVPRGSANVGCQQTGIRGGTFGDVDDLAKANPVPEVVAEQKIKTIP